MRVSLFCNSTGAFSRDIPARAPLWNTVIGEGWAGAPSDSTFVLVRVAGAAGSYAQRRHVQLIVRRGVRRGGSFVWGKTILRRSQPLGVLSPQGRTNVGFWIYYTGCVPLQLTARLGGQAPSPRRVRVVPFLCGE